MKNNLIFQILKLELSKLKKGIVIEDIDFIKSINEYQFLVYLNTSGFEKELIQKQMVELENFNCHWKKTSEGEIFSGFISNSNILIDEMKIAFTILKTDFINFLTQEKLKIKQKSLNN